jgi:ATP-dependent helicase STH1/SNF2
MASPEAVALLDRHAHRMPMRADQIRVIATVLSNLRQRFGPEAARATPEYRGLLLLLRAHTRPMRDTDVSFAQVQAVRLQMLALRLLQEQKPFPAQLTVAIREGLVAGFDPVSGAQVPVEVNVPVPIVPEPNPISWADRRLPVRRVDMSIVKPSPIQHSFLVEERERILSRCMSRTLQDINGFLRAHEMTSPSNGADKLDPRTAALLEGRQRHVRLAGLQRTIRQHITEENTLAEREGRRGSKPRLRSYKQLLKEFEKIDRARVRREEAEEREARKRQQAWMNGLADHTDRYRRFHRDVVRRGVRAMIKSMSKYHDEMSRNATRAERDAEKARIQKLKDDDEEGYLELVRQTKSTRLLELLTQTDQYLQELGAIVKEERAKTGEVEYEPDDQNEMPAKHRYYDIAHAIKEEVTEQPSLLVGGKLKEYQLQGIQWMVSLYNNHLNGILADEMGLGKTIQTLGLITYLMESKENSGPYLIIVPLSTMSNWELEFARWAPAVTVTVFKGDAKNRRHIYETVIEKNKFNVCLATYEYVVRGKNWLKRVHWQHIIIDEGHRIKNHESRLSIVLHTYYTSRSRLLLTGTPLQNSLTELWALLNFLLPNVFKSADSFESWFAAPFAQLGVGNISATEEQAQLTEEESLLIIRRLHQVLRPFLLRRLKADVLRMGEQLPDKREHIIVCEMSAWQRIMYLDIVKSNPILFTDRHGRRRFDKLSNPAMQLRKCVNHPYLFHQDHSALVVDSPDLWRCAGKFDMLDACVTKFLKSGHRILIFNQMTKVVDLQSRLLRYRKISFYRLDGSTPPEDRKRMVSDFNDNKSDVNVFLLTTRAGGLGVNLQTADTVIIFDSDWNPSMDQQAQDRAHRIGQQREVLILRMITAKSVEEDVMQRASFKRGLEEKIIRAGMFDQESKDSERQAMLRELLRVQEAGSDGEDGDEVDGMPTDEDINMLLARSEEEYKLFGEIDKEREIERNHKPKLFAESEIPDFAVIVPKELRKRAKSTDTLAENDSQNEAIEHNGKPRKRAATQNVSYGLDNLTERQYIELLEKSANGEVATISDGVRSVQRRKRLPSKAKKSRGQKGQSAFEQEFGESQENALLRCDEVIEEAGGLTADVEEVHEPDRLMTMVHGQVKRDGFSSDDWAHEGRRRVARVTETDSEDDSDGPALHGDDASDDDDDEDDDADDNGLDVPMIPWSGHEKRNRRKVDAVGLKRVRGTDFMGTSPLKVARMMPQDIMDDEDESDDVEEGEVVEDEGMLGVIMSRRSSSGGVGGGDEVVPGDAGPACRPHMTAAMVRDYENRADAHGGASVVYSKGSGGLVGAVSRNDRGVEVVGTTVASLSNCEERDLGEDGEIIEDGDVDNPG